ncbi:hypothetical protein ACOSQ2_027534 [Xanthoceras sorbifolium]
MPLFFIVSSLNDQECQKADVGGSFAPEERKSRPFDEVVVEFEQFMSKQMGIDCSERAAEAHELRLFSSGDLDESVGIAPEDEVDDSSLVASEVGNFSFPSSIIKREDLVGLVNMFHLPMGYKVLIPRATDGPAHPPSGYVAISSHHSQAGLRFPLHEFIIRVLNLLELASMQLTPTRTPD